MSTQCAALYMRVSLCPVSQAQQHPYPSTHQPIIPPRAYNEVQRRLTRHHATAQRRHPLWHLPDNLGGPIKEWQQ
jgi:hypothetical protein